MYPDVSCGLQKFTALIYKYASVTDRQVDGRMGGHHTTAYTALCISVMR